MRSRVSLDPLQVSGARQVQEEAVVATVIIFGLLAVAMLAIMLYGIFTEGRGR
jgi:hypothetical protein